MVDVRHVNALCLVLNGFLSLLLGTDEQDVATVSDSLLDELESLVDVGQGLLQVDDVDAIALGEDETLHLRVPTTGLVTEVDTCIEQFSHGYNSHVIFREDPHVQPD